MAAERESKESIEDLRRDLDALRGDVKAILQTMTHDGRHKLDEVKDRFWRAARDAENRFEERAKKTYSDVRDTSEETLDRARSEIRERPLTALLSTFAIGLILGKLTQRD